MHFGTFLLLFVKRFQLKIYLCQQQSWLGSWLIWSFANPLWSKYVRTHQFAKPDVFDVLMITFSTRIYFGKVARVTDLWRSGNTSQFSVITYCSVDTISLCKQVRLEMLPNTWSLSVFRGCSRQHLSLQSFLGYLVEIMDVGLDLNHAGFWWI